MALPMGDSVHSADRMAEALRTSCHGASNSHGPTALTDDATRLGEGDRARRSGRRAKGVATALEPPDDGQVGEVEEPVRHGENPSVRPTCRQHEPLRALIDPTLKLIR